MPRALALCGSALLALAASPVRAQPAEEGDALAYRVEVDTVSRLFGRSTDPAGALTTRTAAPLYHYALLRVDDVDTPWRENSIDAELSAWGNLEIGEPGPVGRLDGDVHVASVKQRFRHAYVKLGRQIRAGGAARFARFDGASAGARAPMGLGADAYGGFTVLPRWAAREGYHLLGSTADELLRRPEAFPEPERHQHWLAGGRLYAERPGFAAVGASFHEQAESGGLGYRNAAIDLSLTPIRELGLSGQAIVDIDALSLSDLRASVDTAPLEWLRASVTYQHVLPALLLSRMSVLSVFSTETFDEWGAEAELRPLEWLRLSGEGYLQRFEEGDLGARSGAKVRFIHDAPLATVAGVGYRRVVETENGYHALRASASLRPEPLSFTADGFIYFYDEPIQALSSSIVGVLSAGWDATDQIELLLSSSLARSPYARIDAQGLARLSVALEGGGR
jgi:hypothetical protein